MQETKRKVISGRKFLQDYLWLESTLIQTPLPFNSFPKAKYISYGSRDVLPIYFFTTTCRNTEDCLGIMKTKIEERYKVKKYSIGYYRVFKIQNGIRELIFTDKPIDKP